MAEQNYAAALAMTLPRIVAQYLADFQEGGAQALPAVAPLAEDKKAAA